MKTNKVIVISLFMIICSSIVAQVHPNTTQQSPFRKMDFLIGEWEYDAKNREEDGTFSDAKYITKTYHTFDGVMLQDDFYFQIPNGKWISYGTTVRTYDPRRGKFYMLWYTKDLSFVTQMEGDYEDGEFKFIGKGKDEKGDFISHITFYDIKTDSYRWKADRSYDAGKTWIEKIFSYTATRVKKAIN
ncbi:MAG: DUF1579 family protein [Calditrichaeota bacterium]|nr:DUF1579 family protein [Calditrichota bacterium]